MKHNHIFDVIDAVYEAASTPRKWEPALGNIARLCGAETASIAFLGNSIEESSFWTTGLPEFAQSTYAAHFVHKDPITPVLIKRRVGAVIATEESVIDSRILLRSEFHNDWAHPNGLRHCLVARAHQELGTSVSMVIGRGPSAGSFQESPAVLHNMELLLPHLRRAAQIQLRLEGAVAFSEDLEGCLDAVERCAMLVDSDAKLLHANRPSLSGPLKAGFFIIRRGRLESGDATFTNDLHFAIRRVAMGSGSVIPERLSSSDGRSIEVWPVVGPRSQMGFTRNRATVVMSVREQRVFLTKSVVAQYRLTRAESEILNLLVSGSTVKSIAKQRSTSIGTTRNQVKAILAKLGLNRQVDLVRLIASQ